MRADESEMGERALDDAVLASIGASVLCWLATVDEAGVPNVSPKEVFAALDRSRIVIAHIASPFSVRNVRSRPDVCVSFVDVFAQKGFKVTGCAALIEPDDPDWARHVAPLEIIAGRDFPIRAVISVAPRRIAPIVAPSWRLFPERTQDEQVAIAMRRYGVRPVPSRPRD